MDYPSQHIEVDTLLSWRLGQLVSRYPDALYVHLMRDPVEVAKSHAGRRRGVHKFWWRCILSNWYKRLDGESAVDAALDMIDAVNSNIKFACKDVLYLPVWIETPSSSFSEFWELIDARGDRGAALGLLQSNPKNVSIHSRSRRGKQK